MGESLDDEKSEIDSENRLPGLKRITPGFLFARDLGD